jgi:hypothetical protein
MISGCRTVDIKGFLELKNLMAYVPVNNDCSNKFCTFLVVIKKLRRLNNLLRPVMKKVESL